MTAMPDGQALAAKIIDIVQEQATKIVEIAREQAAASSAMAELHRQNVTRMDQQAALLTTLTNSLVGVSTSLAQMSDRQERSYKAMEIGREGAVEELKEHIAREAAETRRHAADGFKGMRFWREPLVWIGFLVIVLSNLFRIDLARVIR